MELLCPLITVGTTSMPICRVVLPAIITMNRPTIDITTNTTGVSEIMEVEEKGTGHKITTTITQGK